MDNQKQMAAHLYFWWTIPAGIMTKSTEQCWNLYRSFVFCNLISSNNNMFPTPQVPIIKVILSRNYGNLIQHFRIALLVCPLDKNEIHETQCGLFFSRLGFHYKSRSDPAKLHIRLELLATDYFLTVKWFLTGASFWKNNRSKWDPREILIQRLNILWIYAKARRNPLPQPSIGRFSLLSSFLTR